MWTRWKKEYCDITNLGFNVGDTIDYLHGNSYRVVTVLLIDLENKKVLVSGMSSDYWIKLDTLLPKLNITPRGGW